MLLYIRVSCLLLLLTGCSIDHPTLFKLLPDGATGITFTNTITESDSLNILTTEYVHNGGGVAIGDFNNDDLQDVYFTGNMVSNRLYINKGNFIFEDVTDQAKVGGEDRWCSGVTLVDINNDGWLDMYVGATLTPDKEKRANLLYLNDGLNPDGIPTFTESAHKYGIADTGHTTQSIFFDYDKDNDLDLYVMTNHIDPKKPPSTYRHKITDGTAVNNDRLYRNNGNHTFTNVTEAAGILTEGYGLGLAVSDFNHDGWPDIYVTNDYLSNDLLWINNRDGTFSNRVSDYLKHQSASAMGNDVVDINNDGMVDIIALDMLPEGNKRKKMMIRANNYVTYVNNEIYNYEYQYVRNTLQLNRGFTAEGHPVFSEISMLSGIHQTDWSWAPLVADFDNDGFRDLIVTNGFPRDVTDLDFAAYSSGYGGAIATKSQLLDSIPKVKIANYAFHNNGDLTFSDRSAAWGVDQPSYSNGAAYGDLDNDGDLDFVVNNINDKAFVYKNQTLPEKNHYLRVKLNGSKPNIKGLGTRIKIFYGKGQMQLYEHSPSRGYLSSVEGMAHFGLGVVDKVDSLHVYWPDGTQQRMAALSTDQILILKQQEATPALLHHGMSAENNKFIEVSDKYGVNFTHKEADKIDFNVQRTLPHKFTQQGPGIAVGDVNQDGLDDFYIGGSAGEKGTLFLQGHDGNFVATTKHVLIPGEKRQEDTGLLLFDADNDHDLDLYVVSGSYEYRPHAKEHRDRLYINNGQGLFKEDALALPQGYSNGSCVKAADYDRDGDLDLFVGGNVMPGQYPLPSRSYVLENRGGKFIDVTASLCPDLQKIGLVNDALWSDFDNDGQVDLVVVGEYMPVSFFKNNNGQFENITSRSGISRYTGWWNSLVASDFDNDGDIDYVAGNLGFNTSYRGTLQQPLAVYAGDFDSNQSIDAVLSVYLKDEDGEMAPFPVHAKDDLISQILPMKKKFRNYASYSTATVDEVLSPQQIEEALVLKATHMASSFIQNKGNGTFEITALPIEAQFAPVYGMVVDDYNKDGNQDMLLVGNSFATEVTTGRYDALNGLYLEGNGEGEFQVVGNSGFFVPGDASGLAIMEGNEGERLILATQNRDKMKIFRSGGQINSRSIRLQSMDAWAEILYKDGHTRKQEFYYGSTYFSQSARILRLEEEVISVTVYDFRGNSREIVPDLSVASRK